MVFFFITRRGGVMIVVSCIGLKGEKLVYYFSTAFSFHSLCLARFIMYC